MTDISALFDRTGAIRRPDFSQLFDELSALFTGPTETHAFTDLPDGGDQVVLVVPGFLTGDMATRLFREFLDAHGFRSFGWEFGMNIGPTPRALAHLRSRVDALSELNSGPIAIIGISLGGLLARDLAHDCPDKIRHVVTMASPFRLPTASTLEHLVRLCGTLYDPAAKIERLAQPLPVPSTAFFTRGDGVVAWESCRSDDHDCMNIEVDGHHMTITRNPVLLKHLVERLTGDC
ncbi:MAG TPA: alpha/beta fold hydrolase [Alphaproteobacteria bacterium]|jgi:pimeloyl-ACP methyl ester carboxylesterase|nr:alpha/beta fold hydrolase [Alphaproteobacteria bacterium]